MIETLVGALMAFLLTILPVQAAEVVSGLPIVNGVSAGPAEKATGDVGYEAAGLDRHISFNAHEARGDRPAKGQLQYTDAIDRSYHVEITHVNVVGDMAYFAGEVVEASNPTWVGNWISFAVLDGGTPGRNGDIVWGIFTDQATAISNVENEVTPGSAYEVLRGNLVVHSFDGDRPGRRPEGVPPGPPDGLGPQGPPDTVPPGPPITPPGRNGG